MKPTEKCTHQDVTTSQEGGFVRPVYQEPFTHENRRAHGGRSWTETCKFCGARRDVIGTIAGEEHSPWGPSLADRMATERRIAEHAKADQATQDRFTLARFRTQIKEIRGDQAMVENDANPGGAWVWIDDIRTAAEQPDAGDGLVPYYSALLREIGRA